VLSAEHPHYKWVALSNTTLGQLLATVNASIVLISLPAIFNGVRVNPLEPANVGYLLWMLMGYLLVTAVFVVTLGRLGDMYGRVRIYNAGFALFTITSVVLSLDPFHGSGGVLWLIGWRVLQAVGGAMLMANSAAIITDAFPVAQRGMALGVNMVAAVAGMFIGLLVSVNLFVFSDGFVEGLPPGDGHLLFTVPLLGTPVTAESLSLAVTQFTRYLTMATIGFPVAFAIAPSDFGVAFRRLGVPEKFAFGLDLTFRFLPSLAADFQTTVDAQRIRGFDWSGGAAGFLSRVRRSTPVVVPTVVNAIAGAEDTIDAMDLRAFGTGRRSWLRELRYDMQDRLVLLGFTALLVIISILGFMGITSKLYVFPFLLALAGA